MQNHAHLHMSSSVVKKALSSTNGREKRRQTKKPKKISDDTLKDYLIWDKHFEEVTQMLCSKDETIQSSSKSRDDKTTEVTMGAISSKRLVRQRKKLLKKVIIIHLIYLLFNLIYRHFPYSCNSILILIT